MAKTPNWGNEVNPLLNQSMEGTTHQYDLASPSVLDQGGKMTQSMEELQKQIEDQHLH